MTCNILSILLSKMSWVLFLIQWLCSVCLGGPNRDCWSVCSCRSTYSKPSEKRKTATAILYMIQSKNRTLLSHSCMQEWLMAACQCNRNNVLFFLNPSNWMSILKSVWRLYWCFAPQYACSSCTGRDLRRPLGIRLLTTFADLCNFLQWMI